MRRRLGSAVTAITAIGLVGAVCVLHAEDVGAALGSVSTWAIVGAVALHVATLILRSEAWRLTLAAAGGDSLSRSVVHGTNAAAFVAGALQSQAALPARVTLLRRLAGDRAPRPGQICVADVPIFALELCATSALLIAAVLLAGRGPWWFAPGAFLLALAVLLGARLAPERFAHRPIVRGLAILGDRRRRGTLVALVAGTAALTVARVWLILAVCGLPHGLGEVAWVFARRWGSSACCRSGRAHLRAPRWPRSGRPASAPRLRRAYCSARRGSSPCSSTRSGSRSRRGCGCCAAARVRRSRSTSLTKPLPSPESRSAARSAARTPTVAAGLVGAGRRRSVPAPPPCRVVPPCDGQVDMATPNYSSSRSASSVDQPKLRAPSPAPVSGS